jgi:thiamine-monophosphate kinase
MADRPGEFALIAQYLAPLAKACPGALGLADDAAVLQVTPGRELVATKDAVVAGVHFLENESPDVVAARALRVNLSDLAAMGARPKVYLMALALPPAVDAAWLEAFTGQLAADQQTYGITLAGGDTVATPGPLMVSITALGEVPAGAALTRSGARAGDRIYVSGTIGDAGLGLAALKGEGADPSDADVRAAIARHRFPEPRLGLGERLVGLAHAAIDVSDGLVADLRHICDASGRGAEIRADAVPLSAAVRARIAADPSCLAEALTAGDDYELLFTAPPGAADQVEAAARQAGVPVSEIGTVTETNGVTVVAAEGGPMELGAGGYAHF